MAPSPPGGWRRLRRRGGGSSILVSSAAVLQKLIDGELHVQSIRPSKNTQLHDKRQYVFDLTMNFEQPRDGFSSNGFEHRLNDGFSRVLGDEFSLFLHAILAAEPTTMTATFQFLLTATPIESCPEFRRRIGFWAWR
jgi:hypothetical protein